MKLKIIFVVSIFIVCLLLVVWRAYSGLCPQGIICGVKDCTWVRCVQSKLGSVYCLQTKKYTLTKYFISTRNYDHRLYVQSLWLVFIEELAVRPERQYSIKAIALHPTKCSIWTLYFKHCLLNSTRDDFW